MKTRLKLALISAIFLCISVYGYGQDSWTIMQINVIETMNKLSETVSPEGKGADSYKNFLSEDFSRWTIGSAITNNKKKWVEGIREWFDDGWRVSDRNQKILEILILNDFAHTRRIVIETYLGPKGDISTSKAALAEVWVYKNNKWLLHRVNVHPMTND